MLARLKGFKVYLVAALVALVSLLTGGTPEDAANAAAAHDASLGLVAAAGIAFGRALVSLFANMRERGLIQCNPLAIALAAAMLASMPLGGCASLGASVEQVQPQTPREALAVAEITFVGVVTVAADMNRAGVLSNEDARERVLPVLEEADRSLQLARALIIAGDQAQAGRTLAAVQSALTVLSLELARRRDEAASLRS